MSEGATTPNFTSMADGRRVAVDQSEEVYVIHHDGGLDILPFDLCHDRLKRYSLNLEIDPATMAKMTRGSIQAYQVMRGMQAALEMRYEQTGEQAVAELSMQLLGLEGAMVGVQDEEGDELRYFIVGKSDGPLPHHLELQVAGATEGKRCRLEYHRVVSGGGSP